MNSVQVKKITGYINSKIDLIDLLRNYGLEPVIDGQGRHKMRCPFHNENTASFFIYPNNSYYCFGCASGGNVVSFMMAYEHKSFDEIIGRYGDDIDVHSNKFFTDAIINKMTKSNFDLEKYKKNSQYALGIFLRNILYTKPENRDKVFQCFKEMDVFFGNQSIQDEKYVDEFMDSIVGRF
jgi:DNA primase